MGKSRCAISQLQALIVSKSRDEMILPSKPSGIRQISVKLKSPLLAKTKSEGNCSIKEVEREG
jgi:hypothetical protein